MLISAATIESLYAVPLFSICKRCFLGGGGGGTIGKKCYVYLCSTVVYTIVSVGGSGIGCQMSLEG